MKTLFRIPHCETQEEYIKRRMAEGDKSVQILGMLEVLGARGPISRRPAYNNPSQIIREAEKDFGRADYGGAMEYLDSMSKIYDDLESHVYDLHQFLEQEGYEANEEGFPKPKEV